MHVYTWVDCNSLEALSTAEPAKARVRIKKIVFMLTAGLKLLDDPYVEVEEGLACRVHVEHC